MKHRFLLLTYCSVVLLGAIASVAHGDVHQQIDAISARMVKGKPSANEFLQRAELWRIDGNFLSALSDCSIAAKVDPANPFIDLERAKVFSDERRFNKAAAVLDNFLERHPHHAEAFLLRARAWKELGDFSKAQSDYTAAINFCSAPQPDTYFELARLLQSMGNSPQAIHLLEEGSRKLGGPVSLELFAIDLQVESKEFAAALSRLDKIVAQSSRKEKWLARRGEILEAAGRDAEARDNFAQALLAVSALPERFRTSEASEHLLAKINAALQRLNRHE